MTKISKKSETNDKVTYLECFTQTQNLKQIFFSRLLDFLLGQKCQHFFLSIMAFYQLAYKVLLVSSTGFGPESIHSISWLHILYILGSNHVFRQVSLKVIDKENPMSLFIKFLFLQFSFCGV